MLDVNRTYWRMRVTKVDDYVTAYDQRHTEVQAELTDSLHPTIAAPSLPRAGSFFWMIDEDTFNALVRDVI